MTTQKGSALCRATDQHPPLTAGRGIVPDQPAEYIHLGSGFRVIAGLGFPPRRTPPGAGAVRIRRFTFIHRIAQTIGLGASVAVIAGLLLYLG